MSHRAMNNIEKVAAAMLKKEGFDVFYQEYARGTKGDWWATHVKLICQYHIPTKANQALEDLQKFKAKNITQLSLFE